MWRFPPTRFLAVALAAVVVLLAARRAGVIVSADPAGATGDSARTGRAGVDLRAGRLPSGDAPVVSASRTSTGGGPTADLGAALRQMRRCPRQEAGSDVAGACGGILYVWSGAMPLSRAGIGEIASAAAALGLPVTPVEAPALVGGAEAAPGEAVDSLRLAMIRAGATLHHPAVLIHRDGRLVGTAILGYKTAETWARVIEDRLRSPPPADPDVRRPASGRSAGSNIRTEEGRDARVTWRDLPVEGSPGPYFRAVPGRGSLAFEARRVIHLLDLTSGEIAEGPGWIDFIPSPDGRLFVMPGERREGLHFYDAAAVYRGARAGVARDLRPLFVDPALRDQYPSVGTLAPGAAAGDADGGSATVYRVLTSWYDGVVFRDYEVGAAVRGRGPSVRPRGPRVPACPGVRLSIPILSRQGREVAGRDEATGTTKLFRLEDDGSCAEVLDLGIATGKVAFSPDGTHIAFAVPDGVVRDGGGPVRGGGGRPSARDLSGVFVLDRDAGTVRRVEGSRSVDRLTFPDFVGPDSVVFLVPAQGPSPSRFRLAPVPGGR